MGFTHSVTAKAGRCKADMRNLLGRQGRWACRECVQLWGCRFLRGFTVTTEVCTYYYAQQKFLSRRSKASKSRRALAQIEQAIVGAKFGDADNPLLVSVRSGARASMPGMMDTVLESWPSTNKPSKGLKTRSGDARFAYDSYRRFIQMYSNVVLDIPHHKFEELIDDIKRAQDYTLDTQMTAEDWKEVVEGSFRDRREDAQKTLPARCAGTIMGRYRRCVRFVDEPARHDLSPPQRHSARLGHRRERAGDGVRQSRRRLLHGGCFHA